MKTKQIPFSLERYNQGNCTPVVGNAEVRIICTDAKGKFPIIALNESGDEAALYYFYKNGGTMTSTHTDLKLQVAKFNNGDIVSSEYFILIYRGTDGSRGGIKSDIAYSILGNKMHTIAENPILGYGYTSDYHLASEAGKKIFFDALKKEGKYWNQETKKLQNVPISTPFKPFDKVLIRDEYCDEWGADFFGYKDGSRFICISGAWTECIPFNEETEHLLGTDEQCPEKYITWK